MWTKEDWIRFWLHFPVGALGAWFISVNTTLGIMFTVYFLAYEVLNDWRKVDNSYKDVIGAVVGFGVITGIIVLGGLL